MQRGISGLVKGISYNKNEGYRVYCHKREQNNTKAIERRKKFAKLVKLKKVLGSFKTNVIIFLVT
jgi:hypothetical protein